MDNFREEVVVRRRRGLYDFAYIVGWIMMIIFGLIAVMSLSSAINMLSGLLSGEGFDIAPLITLVVTGGIAFLFFRKKDDLKTEYEYTLTNNTLDVSKVLNNSRRRYLTALDLKTVEACGPVSEQGSSFQRYITMKDVKKHNWFLNRDAKLTYFYFTKTSVKHIIILEISEDMLEMIRRANYLNFGVWQG